MSILTALYDSYKKCEESNLVDDHDNPNGVILLPLFHTNLRSNGSNIIKIVLNTESELIRAEFVEDKKMIMFPISEESIIRTSGAAPHPLVDQLSYVSSDISPKKNELYSEELDKWIRYNQDNEEGKFLRAIKHYLDNEDIVSDIAKQISDGRMFKIDDKYILSYTEVDNKGKEKTIKLDLSKTFVTFEIVEFSGNKNYSVDNYIELHNNYIEYQRAEHAFYEHEYCNISGEKMYCTTKHRGIMGSSKLIGVSNNDETYFGRFSDGEQIVKIGYETSQKIHNMLKYLLENNQTSKWLGENSYLITWFSDDISNENEKGTVFDGKDPLTAMGIQSDGRRISYYSVGTEYTREVGLSVFGKEIDRLEREKVFVMIVDKSSPGRVAIKYFREFFQSEFYLNVIKWNDTAGWEMYNYNQKKFAVRTPNIFEIVDYAYGIERDRKIVFDNKKFRVNLIERLIPAVSEGRKLPRDIVVKLFNNTVSRNRYKDRWGMLLSITCAMISKYKFDYLNEITVKKGELIMLDKEKQSRSYVYGRILCILEQIELATYEDYKSSRSTNAQRMWNVYTKAPAKIMMQLKSKLQPYEQRLMKSDKLRGRYIFLQRIFGDLIVQLEATPNFENDRNKQLDEDFLLGYYLQKHELFKGKSEDKEINNIEDNE